MEIRNDIDMTAILEIPGSLLLKMWSVDQQHRHHLGVRNGEYQAPSRHAETESDFNMIPSGLHAH